MKSSKFAAVVLGAIAVVIGTRSLGVEASQDKAEAFLTSLGESKRNRLVLPFESDSRLSWAYTPGKRPGLAFRELEPLEQTAALALLKASLSESGFERVEAIRTKIEPALREMENNPGRDLGLYYYMFFGKPTSTGKWAWRYEGHHISLSFTYLDGRIVSTTPQFLGSNPADVQGGASKGTRVLANEEDLGRDFVKSLSDKQRAEAILSSQAPPEILTSNARKAAIQEDKGISFTALTDEQKRKLQELVTLFSSVQKPDQAKARLDKIEKSGWSKVKFAWMGSLEKFEGHYYRIQGPTFLIEYDNTQNHANHIHTVWRDFEGDFGMDALAEHYRTAEHHRHKH